MLLIIAEDFQVVHSNVANVGIRERWTSTTDAAPCRTTVVVDQDHTLTSFGKVTERSTTCHTTTSNYDFGLGFLDY